MSGEEVEIGEDVIEVDDVLLVLGEEEVREPQGKRKDSGIEKFISIVIGVQAGMYI